MLVYFSGDEIKKKLLSRLGAVKLIVSSDGIVVNGVKWKKLEVAQGEILAGD